MTLPVEDLQLSPFQSRVVSLFAAEDGAFCIKTTQKIALELYGLPPKQTRARNGQLGTVQRALLSLESYGRVFEVGLQQWALTGFNGRHSSRDAIQTQWERYLQHLVEACDTLSDDRYPPQYALELLCYFVASLDRKPPKSPLGHTMLRIFPEALSILSALIRMDSKVLSGLRLSQHWYVSKLIRGLKQYPDDLRAYQKELCVLEEQAESLRHRTLPGGPL